MGDRFELLSRFDIPENAIRGFLAVEGAVRAEDARPEGAPHLGKAQCAQRDHLACEVVGVDNGKPTHLPASRYRALAGGEPSCQAEENEAHAVINVARSRRIRSRLAREIPSTARRAWTTVLPAFP